MNSHAQGPSLTRFPLRRPLSLVILAMWLGACATPPAAPPPEPMVPENQVLRPGDVVQVQVWRQPDYSGEITVGADGNLLHPVYRDLQVEGLTVRQVRTEVEGVLAGYIQGARVVVEPLFRVSVGGEVRQPGVYPMLRGTTVADAVSMAGGPTQVAKLDEVLLLRAGTQYNLRLNPEQLVTFGSLPVVSGDQILIERESDFSIWRDVVGPVATVSALLLTVLRIRNEGN